MNDLTNPLGFGGSGGRKLRVPVGAIAAVITACLFAGLAVWLMVVNDPLGGEPYARAKIETSETGYARADIATVGVKSGTGELLPPLSETKPDAGVTLEGPSSAETAVALPVEADAALIETSPFGPLPRVGADGRRPADVYARPVPGFVGASPKIAIVVGDLGLSQTGTQEAIKILPPEVTLGFAPYGASLDRWTAKARQDGHELLLQVPLEPFDYPDNDPGENTLLVGKDARQNIENLHRVMGRLSTYVGIVNYMGARFTSEAAALDPVMQEIALRGLLYLDDGSSPRSVAEQSAAKFKTEFAKADLVIDAVPTPTEIAARLAQLEQIARTRGLAVGVASARPATLKALSGWTSGLDERGITLVPITAVTQQN
ncbi:divergent polysaccharide deacetylase family protein [Pleomorphomonas sp. JP5]|uniref:divergent polysaccharide deacetylase family protein n=1 Tax=Pleomorphomonas sp. JP5 TaxID=2942998 RepID=UPI002044ADEE|nr:divergent polysaccharide deacetylase family protein [Pleomorphomonas sp. JP5]MCM5559787.1 divergent polysaccharide deacetylase family protein [Pleomorphomonas sp. JP5]